LTLTNAPASMALWTQATAQLRTQLPAEVQAGLVKHDSSALQAFRDRHVCRVAQTPAELAATMAALAADSTVYTAMNGPNELEVTGSLRGWTVMDSLPRIAVPTLVISGAKDIATPECVQPFVDDIPKARQRVFPESSHMPHIEERDAFIRVVSGFLSEVDAPKT
jgi:L-proline amide hydrolase